MNTITITKNSLLEITDQINLIADEWKIPGLSYAIVHSGNIILHENIGIQDIDNSHKVTDDTIFQIGSCTKSFTAASIGILVDEGKLKFDTLVKDILPGFELSNPYITDNLTIRDTLIHNSGLPRYDFTWYHTEDNRETLIERMKYFEFNKSFREDFQYQNHMYMLAGRIIERVSGMPWESFIEKRIFNTLNMNHSSFEVNPSMINVAYPHICRDKSINKLPFCSLKAIGPAGSITSNITDAVKWLIFNLGNGEYQNHQILSKQTFNELHSLQIINRNPMGSLRTGDERFFQGYGMGWFIEDYRGNIEIYHTGKIDGFSAILSYMPKYDIGIVVLCNLDDCPIINIITNKIYDSLLSLKELDWSSRARHALEISRQMEIKSINEFFTKKVENTKPSNPYSDYTGEYINLAQGSINIYMCSGELYVKYNQLNSKLEHFHYNTFLITLGLSNIPMSITFNRDSSDNIISLSIPLEPEVRNNTFVKL